VCNYLNGDLLVGWKLLASLPSDSTVTGDCGNDAPRPLSLSSSLPADRGRNDGGLTIQHIPHTDQQPSVDLKGTKQLQANFHLTEKIKVETKSPLQIQQHSFHSFLECTTTSA